MSQRAATARAGNCGFSWQVGVGGSEDAVLEDRVARKQRIGRRLLERGAGTGAGRAMRERRREAKLLRVAEGVAEVVGHRAGGYEAIRVVAEAGVVRALELDGEIRGAAVVGREEAVGLS